MDGERVITDYDGRVFYARIMSQHGDGIDAAPFPVAHVLTDNDNNYVFGCAGIGLPIIVFLLVLAINGGSFLFTIVLTLVAIVLAVVLIWSAVELQKWSPLEVHFSQWPLELGSTTPARLVRVAKRSVPNVTINTTSEIACEEWVRYTVGTDTRTDERTVYNHETTVTGQLTNNRFDATINIHIPATAGAPTIDLSNNKVKWTVAIDVGELSTIARKADFDLEVASQLDQSLRNVQDTPRGDLP